MNNEDELRTTVERNRFYSLDGQASPNGQEPRETHGFEDALLVERLGRLLIPAKPPVPPLDREVEARKGLGLIQEGADPHTVAVALSRRLMCGVEEAQQLLAAVGDELPEKVAQPAHDQIGSGSTR